MNPTLVYSDGKTYTNCTFFMEAKMLTIGTLSKKTGTKVQTIRYYEQIGLMPEPGRT